MTDFILPYELNRLMSDKITDAGGTPAVTDLRRSDAFSQLFTQLLNLTGIVSLDTIVSSNAIANVAAETAFGPASNQLIFPAGSLNVAGTSVSFTASGVLATTGTPTTLFNARLGGVAGTIVGSGSALTCANNSTAAGWRVDGGFVVRTTGATGTLIGNNMRSSIANAASGAGAALDSLGNDGVAASAATDFTAALTLVITQTWSAMSASNTITMTRLQVTVKRPVS